MNEVIGNYEPGADSGHPLPTGRLRAEAPLEVSSLPTTSDASASWTPHLGGERVVEGVHYGWLMKDHLARYHFACPFCRGKRVLDVATGSGYGANILRRRGSLEVVGVDRDENVLKYAARRYGSHRSSWVQADAYALPFEREFDVVISFETIEHLKEPEQFVIQCKKALKPGGIFIVSTPENVGGPFVSEYHELEFSRDEFRRLLEKHFPSVDLLGQRRELSTKIRPLGDLPNRYWRASIQRGRGSHRFFTAIDRFNKAPSHVLAWAAGLNESFRAQIVPIEQPTRRSRLLKEHYFAMIGICTLA